MEALIFGAGNIGRGFLGLELSVSHDLIYADSNQEAIDRLNRDRSYQIEIAETGERITVPVTRAISVYDEEAINQAVQDAAVITTAVGPNHLASVGRILSQPLVQRSREQNFLNVIACENMVDNSGELKRGIATSLDRSQRDKLATFIGFPSSVVDRISIPALETTRVEQNFEWVADGNLWKAFVPPGCIKFVDELEPYLRRKLYLLNGAHAIVGFMSGNFFKYVSEAMQNFRIRNTVIGHLEETCEGLKHEYGFSDEELSKYRENVTRRFDNPAIYDLTSRLTAGQIRKLGREERLVGPALLALQAGIKPVNIAKGIASLLRYEKGQDSTELQETLSSRGVQGTLQKYSGLNPSTQQDATLIDLVKQQMARL